MKTAMVMCALLLVVTLTACAPAPKPYISEKGHPTPKSWTITCRYDEVAYNGKLIRHRDYKRYVSLTVYRAVKLGDPCSK